MKQLVFLFFLASILPKLTQAQIKIPYQQGIELDGILNEWNEASMLSKFKLRNDADTNETTVYAAWDELNLYIALEVRDAHLILLDAKDKRKAHLNDAVEIYIDPLNDSEARMDVNDYQLILTADGRQVLLKGDHRAMETDQQAPKQFGISTLVLKHKIALNGSLNDANTDEGYTIECSIPFAGIGIDPRKGYRFKLDFCVDDADEWLDLNQLEAGTNIPAYTFSSWKNKHDFSFPDQWEIVQLDGEPTWYEKIFQRYGKITILTLILLLAFVSFLFGRVYLKNRQLRSIPKRTNRLEAIFIPDLINTAPPETNKILKSIHPQIARCKQYILDHLQDEISVPELARHLHLSVRQVQRLFKEHEGIGPNSFILALKMEEAALRFKKGNSNVSEVAWELGYEDVSYFSKLFKRYFGVLPSVFLKENKETVAKIP